MPTAYDKAIAAALAKDVQRPPRLLALQPAQEDALEARAGVVCLTLPYPPSGNTYVRHTKDGRHYLTQAAKQFKADVAAIIMASGAAMFLGPVAVTARFYRPRQCGDLDNLLKVTFDALESGLIRNDRQVVSLVAGLLEDKANPRAEIEVKEI